MKDSKLQAYIEKHGHYAWPTPIVKTVVITSKNNSYVWPVAKGNRADLLIDNMSATAAQFGANSPELRAACEQFSRFCDRKRAEDRLIYPDQY